MATIKTFEDIGAWQKARILSKQVFELTLTGSFSKDYALRDQINRSMGSVMDNIAEGFERGGTREFIQFLSIARGSAGEVRSQLHRALDRKHLDREVRPIFGRHPVNQQNANGLYNLFEGIKSERRKISITSW